MARDLVITPVLDAPDLRLWEHRAESRDAVMVLSGVGTEADVPPGHEFARSASGNGTRNVLFVSDPNRTWLNGPGLIETIVERFEEFVARCGSPRTIALGHSMGGFAALVLSGFTRLDCALALAPQYSIDPQVVPDEHRWMEHREKITEVRIRTAAEHMNETTDYVIVHGRHPREAVQRDKFPLGDNIRHFILPRTHHDVPQKLKMAGVLAPFMKAVIDGRVRRARLILQENFGAELRRPQETGGGASA
ncbi:alpha/beta fold hydrolase [Nioella nitratireducens]|uniref:hypothetical protein n=1 Tax=Nioella nitratireducens TaxID=1287720 RepID=UPI0008FD7123|nr:hypothetical protein [Nioella nitratireducens]